MGAMPGMYAGGAGTMGAGQNYWAEYYNAQQKARGGPDTGLKGMAGGLTPSPDAARGFDAIKAAVEGAGGAIADTLDQMGKFNSLAELFGQTTSGIPVEVYSDMAAALADAGMAQEDINAALDDYEHKTGMATDASDLYGQYVDTLADKLATGKIKQEEFTGAMLALSNASPAVYDAMGKISDGIKEFVSDPLGAIGGLFGGGGECAQSKGMGAATESPFGPILDDVTEIDTLLTERPTAWHESMSSAFDLSRGYMVTFADDSVAAFDRIATEGIDKLDGRVIHVTIEGSIMTAGGPDATRGSGTGGAGSPMIPSMASGGHLAGGRVARVIEDNVPEMFAVGGRQYVMAPRGGGTVIPMREITPAALAGGRRGDGEYSKVYLDGKELQQSWVEHRRVQNRAT